ncbi:hypothetical protein Droror1_Dr00017883, partial [Drosera rotundifolia]
LPLSDLIGSLITYEKTLKQQEEDEVDVLTRMEALALQAIESTKTYEACGGCDDETIAFLSRRYFNSLKKKDDKKKVSGNFSSKSTSDPCLNCDKIGHFKKDCPMLKLGDFEGKKLHFSAADRKKAMLLACEAWDAYNSISDEDSDDESKDEESSKDCLMAEKDFDASDSYDEVIDVKTLTNDLDKLSKANMIIMYERVLNELDGIIDEKLNLESEFERLRDEMNKSSNMLNLPMSR